MKLSFTLVDNWIDAVELMHLRNTCRESFTHFNDLVTIDMQSKFFHEELQSGKREAYLLRDDRKPIGFGMLSNKDGKQWMTMGLHPAWRGKRLSYLLTDLITAMGTREKDAVWLDVFTRSHVYSVYERCGYIDVATAGNLSVMCHPNRHGLLPDPMFKRRIAVLEEAQA